ncbi:MAG: hypothetical protein ACI9EF_002156, partial [Pseudohongiellaceae bacterium]
MKPTLQRMFIGTYLGTVATAGLSAAGLFVSLDMALARGGDELLSEAFAALIAAAPSLCGPLLFVSAMMTIGRFHREGSLLSLATSGMSLRVVGGWLLLASLPFAGVVQWAALAGVSGGESAVVADSARGGALVSGGLFVRARTDGGRLGPAVVWPAGESRVLTGVELPGPANGSPSQVFLRVFEEWSLPESAVPLSASLAPSARTTVTVERPWTWSGQLLDAPRSLVWDDVTAGLDLGTLQGWIAAEPHRADLVFARGVKLRAGLRVLLLIWIGCGFWLRPAPSGLA